MLFSPLSLPLYHLRSEVFVLYFNFYIFCPFISLCLRATKILLGIPLCALLIFLKTDDVISHSYYSFLLINASDFLSWYDSLFFLLSTSNQNFANDSPMCPIYFSWQMMIFSTSLTIIFFRLIIVFFLSVTIPFFFGRSILTVSLLTDY